MHENYLKWQDSHYKHIDVIVSSGEIRKLFFQRCKDMNVDPYRVAMAAGIKPSVFKQYYVDNPEPICAKPFNQSSFIKTLEIVGIDIKVLVKTKPFNETYVTLRNKGILKDDE